VRRQRVPIRVSALATTVSAAAVIAGCGGHAVTKHDVVARGDAICFQSLQSIRSVPPPRVVGNAAPSFSDPRYLISFARYANAVQPILAREIERLRALPRPSQDRSTLNAFLNAIGAEGDDYHAIARAASSGDVDATTSALARLAANPARRLARRYGLRQCTGVGGTATGSG
jgi:hypothetical protein